MSMCEAAAAATAVRQLDSIWAAFGQCFKRNSRVNIFNDQMQTQKERFEIDFVMHVVRYNVTKASQKLNWKSGGGE